MTHILSYTRKLSCSLLLTGGLLAMVASCTSEATDTAVAEASQETVVFPKEELHLAINSTSLTVSEATRASGEKFAFDSVLTSSDVIGFYMMHEQRYKNHKAYLAAKDFDKYVYGDSASWYNYTNDGYDNIQIVPQQNQAGYTLSLGKPIYYPWGKALANDDKGQVAIITYSPYNADMDLETMEDSEGKYTFSVKSDQSTTQAVKNSDLLIGLPWDPDSQKCVNPFRRPATETVNIPMRHVLSKITLNASIAATDSTKCDSIKIYVKNVSTDAYVDFFYYAGMESIQIRNKNSKTYPNSEDALVTDIDNDFLPCTSHAYSPVGQVLMCMKKNSNPYKRYIDDDAVKRGDTISIVSSAIVVPGYVPNLQFSIRLYGASRNDGADKRSYDYDEYGHFYAEYSPKPVATSNLETLESGVQYRFTFSGSKNSASEEVIPVPVDPDDPGSGDDPWIVGGKPDM